MRKLFAFHGGIHPPAHKQASVRTAIADAGIPPELIIPLSQHIGTPAVVVVSVGEHVLKGQMIAAAQGFVSVPQHAPTSGTIHAIEDRLIAHPSGHLAPCIVLIPDGRDEWIACQGTPDYQALDNLQLIELIRRAGIAGKGGAGFPSSVKLSFEAGTRIETLIINGAECEPYITADDMLMRERADQIIEGAKILRHIISPQETLIGVEDDKPEAIAALRAAAQDSGIEVVAFPARYPSGGEKQLIEILTGKQVPSGGLPSQVGVVCQNIGSAVAIYEAVVHGRPLISRVTTVTGDAVREAQNFQVLIGTPMRYLLDKAGFEIEKSNRLIMGGSMMGFTVPSLDVPVVKTTNCLLAASAAELPTPPPAQACIRCGMCAEACPVSLLPQQLFWFAQGREVDKLEQHNLFDCIECGACSYVCPSNIPLVQYYRASKAEILKLRHDRARAEAARLRFESRQQRLVQAEADKEEKRAARKQAAEQRAQTPSDDSGSDPIQAALARAKAKKAAQATGSGESEQDKLEQAVVTAQQRLATASAKLEEATAQGSDLVEALQSAVDKTRAKRTAAERALAAYQQAHQQDITPDAAAKAAIEKAVARRQAQASLSPVEKARADLAKLRERLHNTEEKLARSSADGEQEKVIVALEMTVTRLQEKISATEQQLHAAENA